MDQEKALNTDLSRKQNDLKDMEDENDDITMDLTMAENQLKDMEGNQLEMNRSMGQIKKE